jgi:5-methylcytosine-specific restriction protein A
MLTQCTETLVQEKPAIDNRLSRRLVLHRSREQWKRDDKIAETLRNTNRLACEVPGCEFDFREKYGELGKEYAHVHHRKSLASTDKPRQVKLKDLAIVCANCHAMIHRNGKCRPLEGLIPTIRCTDGTR